jgi:excinuclease ABC subunit A
MTDEPCPDCRGRKLNNAVSMVTVGGVSLPEISFCSVLEALAVVQNWRIGGLDDTWSKLEREEPHTPTVSKTEHLDERSLFIAHDIIKEIESRLRFLALVGLDYLTLDRRANTLSGGESQRIRLATQIGTRLTGVMYVLDEPSIGLHPRDNGRLLETLRELTSLGNTLLVVEHDEATLRQADWLVDLGPGAGKEGGRVVSNGSLEQLLNSKESVTGAYLSGRESIPLPEDRATPDDDRWLVVTGARQNNLQDIDVRIPLGCIVAVSGVSGSGKSSLVTSTIAPSLQRKLHGADTTPGHSTPTPVALTVAPNRDDGEPMARTAYTTQHPPVWGSILTGYSGWLTSLAPSSMTVAWSAPTCWLPATGKWCCDPRPVWLTASTPYRSPTTACGASSR